MNFIVLISNNLYSAINIMLKQYAFNTDTILAVAVFSTMTYILSLHPKPGLEDDTSYILCC